MKLGPGDDCFSGSEEPPISLESYVSRLIHYTNVWARDKDGLVGFRCAALVFPYLERLSALSIRPTRYSIHRYFLTSFLLALKFTEDAPVKNSFVGRLGGCTLEDINQMELALCLLLWWNVAVTADDFENQQRTILNAL